MIDTRTSSGTSNFGDGAGISFSHSIGYDYVGIVLSRTTGLSESPVNPNGKTIDLVGPAQKHAGNWNWPRSTARCSGTTRLKK